MEVSDPVGPNVRHERRPEAAASLLEDVRSMEGLGRTLRSRCMCSAGMPGTTRRLSGEAGRPLKQTITAACDIRTLASLALLIARSQLPVELSDVPGQGVIESQ
jgi:hypothetical protein